MMHKKVIAFTLTFLLLLGSASEMTRLATANFLPPPPELPHVYILSDGSISPQTLPIQHSGDLYTLTSDISDLTLEIQKEGIVLDGAGFTMHGNTSGTGILINGTKNITIQNLTLTSFRIGILIEQSSSNIITTNTLTNCEIGLHLNHAQNIQIINNHITANSQTAIVLYSFSRNNQIENNLINDNGNGIWCEFPGSYKGTNDDNKIIGNTIANNTGTAILLRGSANDWIQENNITGNQYGIGLSGSSCNYNTITQNNLVENREKNIDLSGDSKYNLITKNLIAKSQVGLYIFNSNGSEIYLNNFIENQKQVDNDYVENFGPAVNFWDKDNQGNYWSDTANTTYVIDSSNIDHYPLNMPVSGVAIPEFSIWVILAFFSVLTLFVLVLRKRGFRDVSVYCF